MRRKSESGLRVVGLLRVGATPSRFVSPDERALEELVAHLARLDADYEALAAALVDFSEKSRTYLGPTIDALFRARQTLGRLERLESDLALERERPGEPRAGATPGRSRRVRPRPSPAPAALPPESPGDAAPGAVDTEELSSAWHLKDLYRRLARRTHPDLARDDEDRAFRSSLMAKLNAAYADEDRVRLELLGRDIDTGGHDAECPESRHRHAEGRVTSLTAVATRLERDLVELRSGSAHRRLQEMSRHTEQGVDYFAARLAATEGQLRDVLGGIEPALRRIDEAVRAANAARPRKAPSSLQVAARGPGQLTAEGSRFSVALLTMAREAPWKAAWVVAAFFGELAEPPPAGLTSMKTWAERYEALRPRLRGAPPFDHALTHLPACLELGCRVHASGLRFGVRLGDPRHLAGVSLVLAEPPLSAIAADVLRVLGPAVPCAPCGQRVLAVHAHRVADLDPLHALLCPRCGTVLESYRAYGRPEGLEALSPYARSTGAVEEQIVRFGGVSVRLELLPRERERLTAGHLARHFTDVLLASGSPEERPRTLRVTCGGRPLAATALVPRGATIALVIADGQAPAASGVVALLRARCRRRFQAS